MRARLAIAAAVLVAGAGAAHLSGAAFTAGADDAPASFTGGRLALAATPGATETTTLDTANMRPGQTRTGLVELRNDGTVAGRSQLSVRTTGSAELADVLRLRLEDCPDSDCAAPAPRLEAALTNVTDQPLGPIAAGTTRTYRVSVVWPADQADPALQGASTDLSLVWTALAGASA